MSDLTKTRCPECGAVNGPGAPRCHTCGLTLRRAGFAARPADDDEDEPPRKPVKKPAPDAVQKGAPSKKPARPADDEDDEDQRRPAKKARRDEDEEDERRPAKKSRRRDEDDEPAEEATSIRDNAVLNMFFPVGVSLWAMGANYMGLFAAVSGFFGFLVPFMVGSNMKVAGYILSGFGVFLGFIAIILGGLSFIIRPKKTTYGSLTGYIRALVGMFLGLIALVGGPIVIWIVWRMQF